MIKRDCFNLQVFSRLLLAGFFSILLLYGCHPFDSNENHDWTAYLGDKTSSQYSSLTEINLENVVNLQQVWSYSSMDRDTNNRSQIQCNPLIIDGVLYGTSAKLKLFALSADTGQELWSFDPFAGAYSSFGMGVNRGLVYYESKGKNRILFSASHFLYSINVEDGILDTSFGTNGKVDLKKGLGRDVDDLYMSSNTPGILYKDLLIMGQRVSESTGAAPGFIRAYDVHSGAQVWMFKTIPFPGEKGYDTWPSDAYKSFGGANVWAGMSLDEERGIVYCPTGSASFDFYGGDRKGENLFANSIVALDVQTGEYIWHFQTVHHDIWDKDLPAPPNLMTIEKDGQHVDVVAQITKNGHLFVLDRETGTPLFPIEEEEVPRSDLTGEQAWPTQPKPTAFPAFARTNLTEDDLAIRSDEASAFANDIWSKSKPFHIFQPPSEQGTIIFPGFDGGGEWGGAAHDPLEGLLVVNSNAVPWMAKMNRVSPVSKGEGAYITHCASCHGVNFDGGEMFGNVPAIHDLNQNYTLTDFTSLVETGKGVMPSFKFLNQKEVSAIYQYINGTEVEQSLDQKEEDEPWPYPYRFNGYTKLYAPDGYPMITPPWGELTAIDMNTRKVKWRVPLGEHEELSAQGMPITGTENYGGPIITAGGLVFIASTMDQRIRAFDKNTGQEIWSADLPAAGYATPSTYAIDGKQYVVVACGGGKLGSQSGDEYVAFGL